MNENLPSSQTSPPVILWYRVYSGAMTFMYFASVTAFTWVYFFNQPEKTLQEASLWVFRIYWWAIIILCLLLGIAFLLSFFFKPKPWVWIYNLVLICLGLTSACCLPASVPLLIYWLKPETKAYFGRS